MKREWRLVKRFECEVECPKCDYMATLVCNINGTRCTGLCTKCGHGWKSDARPPEEFANLFRRTPPEPEPRPMEQGCAWLVVEMGSQTKCCPECGGLALEGQEECSACGHHPKDDLSWRVAGRWPKKRAPWASDDEEWPPGRKCPKVYDTGKKEWDSGDVFHHQAECKKEAGHDGPCGPEPEPQEGEVERLVDAMIQAARDAALLDREYSMSGGGGLLCLKERVDKASARLAAYRAELLSAFSSSVEREASCLDG